MRSRFHFSVSNPRSFLVSDTFNPQNSALYYKRLGSPILWPWHEPCMFEITSNTLIIRMSYSLKVCAASSIR